MPLTGWIYPQRPTWRILGFLILSIYSLPRDLSQATSIKCCPHAGDYKGGPQAEGSSASTHPWWCRPLSYLSEHCTAQQRLKPRTSAVIRLPLHLTPTMKSIFCYSYLLVLSAPPCVSMPLPLVWISPELLITSCCAHSTLQNYIVCPTWCDPLSQTCLVCSSLLRLHLPQGSGFLGLFIQLAPHPSGVSSRAALWREVPLSLYTSSS